MALPESYKAAAPIPEKTLAIDVEATDKAVDGIMKILSE